MDKSIKPCNFLAPDVIDASVHYYSYKLIPGRIRRRLMNTPRFISFKIHAIATSKTSSASPENTPLNLQPGEWAQVKSLDEIYQTLDKERKYKGLFFMAEMEKFCGEKFKVSKRVEIIKLESTGEVRKLKSPTVFLVGTYCDGERQDGCDRACFLFWREVWLKRIADK
jgi:hypothetical protein